MSEWIIEDDDATRRVDRIIRSILSHLPLSLIYSSIRKGLIKLNNKRVVAKEIVNIKDILYIDDSLMQKEIEIEKISNRKKDSKESKKMKVDILLRSPQLLFVNKKMGEPSHGKNSIDEKVKQYFPSTSQSLSFSVGTLHRLDKDTTGIITFSQNLLGAHLFSDYLRDRLIFRYYIGINEGKIKNGTWIVPSNNNSSNELFCNVEMTDVWEIEYSKKHDLSLVAYSLITGKKHQIRRAANFFKKNLFCDSKYGSKKKEFPSYFLHSFALEFSKEIFKEVPRIIKAPLPKRFLLAIEKYFPASANKIKEYGNIGFLDYILKNTIKKKKC